MCGGGIRIYKLMDMKVMKMNRLFFPLIQGKKHLKIYVSQVNVKNNWRFDYIRS